MQSGAVIEFSMPRTACSMARAFEVSASTRSRKRRVLRSGRSTTDFKSKDELLAAHLESRDQPNLVLFAKWFDEANGLLANKIEAIFVNVGKSARHPKWKGCGFLRTAAELANMPGHPAVKVGAAHKKKFAAWLSDMIDADGLNNAPLLAR